MNGEIFGVILIIMKKFRVIFSILKEIEGNFNTTGKGLLIFYEHVPIILARKRQIWEMNCDERYSRRLPYDVGGFMYTSDWYQPKTSKVF